MGRPVRKNISLSEATAKAAAFDLEMGRFNDVINTYLEAHYLGGGGLAALERRKLDLRNVIDRAQIELASIDQQTQAVVEVGQIMAEKSKAESTLREHITQQHGNPNIDWRLWLHPGRSDVKAVGGMKRAKAIFTEVTGLEL